MLALILFLIFGLLFGFFATINTELVTVDFGTTSIELVPLYIVVLASLATGIVVAAIFYFLKSIGGKIAWGKKEKELREAKEQNVELTKKIHDLELENTKLKTENGIEEEDEQSL